MRKTEADDAPSSLTVLLTGAASGIGRNLAGHLARRGHRLLLADLDEDGLLSTLTELDGEPGDRITRVLDVRDPEGWRAALGAVEERWGPLDVLLNVAGVIAPGFVHETELADIDRQLDVNVRGVVLGTRLAAERMVAAGRGHVVNIASLAGLAPVPGIAVYSATKFAVRGFSLAANLELAPRGVTVTVVCPDLVDTPMLDLQLDFPEQAALTFSGPGALSPDDVSRAVLHALETRPREVVLPWSRGWMARIASLFPGVGAALRGPLARKGRRRIEWLRARRGDRSRS